MSLDQLISRYLDGELSSGEDIQLRSLLKDSREAKADFDSAVLLNAALREDAQSISTPDDLLRDTEDLIMMEIMKDYKAPVSIKRKTRKFAWLTEHLLAQTWRPAYNFAMAVVAITGIFAISDISDPAYSPVDSAIISKIENKETGTAPKNANGNNLASKAVISRGRGKGSVPTAKPGSKIAVSIANLEENSSNSIDAPAVDQTDIIANAQVAARSANSDNNMRIDGIELSSAASNSSAVKLGTPAIPQGQEIQPVNAATLSPNSDLRSSMKPKTAKPVPSVPMQGGSEYNINNMVKSIASFDEVFDNNEVQLTTFFGNDMYSKGLGTSKKGVSHFSQSVSYSMNPVSRLGMEFGMTEYGYERNSYVSLSGGKSTLKTEGFDPIGGETIGIIVPVKINEVGQMMWGAIFYENKLLSYDWAELTARGGLGFTGDGPLGYVRLYGKINLFSGFSLTIGTEAREYSLIIGTKDSKYKFSNLLMYGVQFKL